MYSLLDWVRAGGIARPLAALFGLALVAGAVLSVLVAVISLLVTVVVTTALVLFILGTAAALVWMGVHLGTAIDDGSVRERDSLASLRERYIEGTLTEAEFERRVAAVLAADDAADRETDAVLTVERAG